MTSAAMSAPLCGGCAKPLTDMAYLCLRCSSRLRRDLAALPALLADVQVTMARQSRTTERTRAGGEEPLPVNRDAADVIFHGWNLLGTWARDIAETRGHQLPWDRSRGIAS